MRKLFPLAISLAVSGTAMADAVSGVNGKVDAFAGKIDSSHTENLAAAIAMPLGKDYGLQLDALVGQIGSNDLEGLGVHAFRRDPSRYLLGATAAYVELGSTTVERYGVEGEWYTSQLTVAGALGYQGGDVSDDGYVSLEGRYYATDDLMVTLGASYADNADRFGLGAEYQTPLSGLSLFAVAMNGNDNFDAVVGGLRYYFGSNKSLKQRHREDDPVNSLFATTTESLGSVTEAAAATVSAPTNGGDSGDGGGGSGVGEFD